jgi:predicted nucleic acid-binding protein
MTTGKRRSLLIANFERLPAELIQQRIAPFDGEAAQRAADLMATRQKKGRSGELRDSMIAGIALASHATLATRTAYLLQQSWVYVSCPCAKEAGVFQPVQVRSR